MGPILVLIPLAAGAAALGGAPPVVTRADVAGAYLRLERALRAHPPAAAQVPEINDEFDALTGLFFSANMGGVIQRLDALARRIEGLPEATVEQQVAAALRVEIDPPVGSQAGAATVQLRPLYPVEMPAELRVTVRVRLVHPSGEQAVARDFVLDACRPGAVVGTADVNTPTEPLLAGSWSVRVDVPGDEEPEREVQRWALCSGAPPSVLRRNLLSVLHDVSERHPGLGPAIAVARSRIALLTDRPSSSRGIEFLSDPTVLAEDLESELRALLEGRDPYARRAGDWWCAVPRDSGREIPARIYAPARTVAPGRERPALVIALHGAGGDENMFMDGYGAGEIKRQADVHGLVVVSPGTSRAGAPEALDDLIAFMERLYPIDPDRVYLLGHSMGAGAAASLAASRAERLAAVACIAGGPTWRIAKGAPILVMGAERDGIIPARRLEAAAEQARTQGLDVEYRLIKGYGHTLAVGAALGSAIDWLLEHRRAEPAAPVEAPEPAR